MSARVRTSAVGLLLLAAAAAQGASSPSDKSGVAYRWVDEKGVVHYGDRIPPEYAQKESVLLNDQGVALERREGTRTPEQLAEEARRQAEQQARQQRDNFLLKTYSSVAEIEHLRDLRLEQLAAQRIAAEQQLESLNGRLAVLQKRALNFKPYGGTARMPDDLAADLVRTVGEMRTQREAIAARRKEEDTVRAQFQSDIDRFYELRAGKTVAAQR